MTEEDRQKDEQEALKAEEEKKKQRAYYSFTNASVSLEASTPAEPEEGKTTELFGKGMEEFSINNQQVIQNLAPHS